MPSVQLLVNKSLGLDANTVAKVAHDAVKNGIGKPDMYITVAVTMADCVLVGGKPASVLAQVDSIGGNFAGFVKELCKALLPLGVDASLITATFRSVSMKEFAMNGSTLG
eukprot:CAMPEP_0119314866 /NCGR_PEP_ID=MMETSP1333-20130426/34071_1 /TAXON_ID=418940 /ORGANISM="Scyphosphaera apsteinii, Strain RCC1455" /LENGTH=109 /DNA_ID=CAMNT_0007320065 /DNA_START=27 /DNA_END=356 /DNA_ORIENTATION=-